jgi:hypothetical protein
MHAALPICATATHSKTGTRPCRWAHQGNLQHDYQAFTTLQHYKHLQHL